jgi:ribonuclease HI
MTAPALGLPVQDKFQLYVYEKGGLALGVVTQLQGITPQPVGYLSKELDQVAKGWPGCLRTMATVSLLVPEAQKLILNCPLTVYTTHNLGGILNSKEEPWLSDSRLLKYQAQLLGGTEITLRSCQSLNPASLLPEAEGNPEHSCEEVLMESYAARPDLTDWPLKNPDLELYTDGSSFVKNCVRHAGFAAVAEFGILKSGPLPPNTSAQLAELVALTEALGLSKEQRVNIYTDSKYAFLILHAHAAIWKERGMLSTTGSPIKYARDIPALLDAVLLPKEVSVINCRGHQKGEDKIAKGNKAADEAVKWAAMQEYIACPFLWEGTLFPQRDHNIDQRKVSKLQSKGTS